MKLQPKSIRYSPKQGVSIHWQRPDEVVLGSEDLLLLLQFLKGFLTQAELDAEFQPDEQAVIQRYWLQTEQKQTLLLETYRAKSSLKKMKADFRQALDWWAFCYADGIQQVMARLWGWRLSTPDSLPLLDRLILNALETDLHQDRARIHYLIASHWSARLDSDGPLPGTVQQVEALFGPLDWDALKKQAETLHQTFGHLPGPPPPAR